MIASFLHWLNVEYWTASWPNVFAPSFWTLLGIGLSHYKLNKQHHKLLRKLDGNVK